MFNSTKYIIYTNSLDKKKKKKNRNVVLLQKNRLQNNGQNSSEFMVTLLVRKRLEGIE